MKKKLLLILTGILLGGCSLSKPSFCFSNDPTKVYVQRNGDLFDANAPVKSYKDFGRHGTALALEQVIDSGNQAFLFIYGKHCSHCETFLPILSEMEFDSKIEFFYCEVYDDYSELTKLVEYYSKGNYSSILDNLQTPSLFLLRSALTIEEISLSKIKSATALENKIDEIANVTNIYTFTSYSAFIKSVSTEGLAYFFNRNDIKSNTFYCINIAPFAKTSYKTTSIVYWDMLSDIDKNNFTMLFSLKNDAEVVLTYTSKANLKEKYSYISDTENCINLIKNYY